MLGRVHRGRQSRKESTGLMETVCMHCRRMRTPRGRWVSVPDEKIEALREAGQIAYSCCFACARDAGPRPERPSGAVER
jgi:hypothetical protein